MLRLIQLVIFVAGFAGSVAQAQPRSLGVFGLWGAFRDEARCYAIAQPVSSSIRGGRPFASVGYFPRQGARGQLHFRLGGEQRAGSAVLLRIDQRTFQLTGRGSDAWTPDARADQEITSSMRTGVAMVVETRSTRGGIVRDQYRLRGAPSAIDAAAIACAR